MLFLIGFFWLIFAIIGVHSFKSSLSRQCVWLDPLQPTNLSASYTNNFTFCGGHLDNRTGEPRPWVAFADKERQDLTDLTTVAKIPKGYLCPRGSICLQQENPYNGTVHFDNIYHSLELVFVIMSANTFSDLMYYTTNSDYLPAALFFGVGIMFMMLWLINLLIAVITSSFQVIREESKASAFAAKGESSFVMPPRPGSSGRHGIPFLQKAYRKTSWIWVVIIAFDMLVAAFRSSEASASRLRFIDTTEVVATILLDIEIVIRIVANFRGFHRSLRNLVDLTLAVATSVILIPPIREATTVYAWLTVFQIIRVYRVVLAIPITRNMMKLVLGNATGIGNLMLFVFLITFLMAIFASQLFRGELPERDSDGNVLQVSFYNIWNSFLGMYQVLSSENWTAVLYRVTAYTHYYNTAWIGAMFVIGWFILSFFILVNMFIAVIQENFDVSEDVKRMLQVRAFLQKKELGSSSGNLALASIFSLGRASRRRDPLDYGPAMVEMLLKDTVVRDFLDETMDPLQDTGGDSDSPDRQGTTMGRDVKPGFMSALWGKVTGIFGSKEPNPFYSNIRFDGPSDNLDPREMARQAVSATAMRRKAQREYLMRHPTYNTTLFIFTPRNRLRLLCQRLVGPGRGSERIEGVEPNKIAWYTFSAFIYAAIVAMVVLAAIATPLYQKEYTAVHSFRFGNWFIWTDVAFTFLFSTEALIKVIADGFLWTPNAYFRSSWGVIDGVVLVTLWINVITVFANGGAVSRAVGAFKALRALRLLNVSDSARETFHSLLLAWKILGGAAFVSICLLIPFAIYGVNLFHSQLVLCNDSNLQLLQDCFGEYNSTPFSNQWPMVAPRVAANPYYSFDDFGSSLFTLFQIVSQEGWVDVSFSAQAITGPGMQPQPQSRPGNAVFFVVFNLLATVFVLTLFISIFMRNYTEQTGVAFLTAEQRSWLELRKMLRQISPSKASYDALEKRWKKWCHKRAIEKRGKWHIFITCVLVFHLILLLLEFYDEPVWWTRARDLTFLAFTLIYMVNIVIRIVGLGWTRFRRSSWDLYSLFVVLGAFASSILLISRYDFETYIQLHKTFLVAIVLLLIPRNDALDQLFKTAAASLTTIGNLLATWLVLFLVFAIAMTQAFSLTRFGPNEDNVVNFRTVPHALILLFRVSVGEGWNEIMEDYADIAPPFCTDAPNFFDSDCGSAAWARFLFCFWNILSMYIFVNLFVSLIYESFSYVYQRSSGVAALDRDEIRRFKEAWRSVDPLGTGFISKEAFPRLLGELSGVFEMRIYDTEDSVRRILEDVCEPDHRANGASSLAGHGHNHHHGLLHRASRHASLISTNARATIPDPHAATGGIDLKKLNERVSKIDIVKVRERRRRFNLFYEEVMVSADPDKGISFTQVLMILAYYNIINDSKSFRYVLPSPCYVL